MTNVFSNMFQDRGVVVGIDRPTETITQRDTSHQGSWERVLLNQLKHAGFSKSLICTKDTDYNDLDILLLSYGMNYQGSFNVFGGASNELARKLKRIYHSSHKVVSYEIHVPDIGEWVIKRQRSCEPEFKSLDPAAFSGLHLAPRVDKLIESDTLIFGDSHCLSVYEPGAEIIRVDGLTLYGALKRGLHTYIEPRRYKKLVSYLGNIDIRFHLVDRGDSLEELVKSYFRQLSELGVDEVEVVGLLPIENESRKIPGTGQYKGKNFNGTWEQRNDLRIQMNALLIKACHSFGFRFYAWPSELLNAAGELDFKWMEAKQSVHLNRKAYRYVI